MSHRFKKTIFLLLSLIFLSLAFFSWLFLRSAFPIFKSSIDYALQLNQSEKNIEHLQKYLSNLPNREKVNASIYSYELFAKDMQKHLEEGNYLEGVDVYVDFLTTFFEGELEDQSYVQFLFAKLTEGATSTPDGIEQYRKKLIDNQTLIDFFLSTERSLADNQAIDITGVGRSGLNLASYYAFRENEKLSERKSKSTKKIMERKSDKKDKSKQGEISTQDQSSTTKVSAAKLRLIDTLLYSKAYLNILWQIVIARENYFWELAALKEAFSSNLLDLDRAKNKQEKISMEEKNIWFISWAATRYPQLVDYQKLLDDKAYFTGGMYSPFLVDDEGIEKKEYEKKILSKKLKAVKKTVKVSEETESVGPEKKTIGSAPRWIVNKRYKKATREKIEGILLISNLKYLKQSDKRTAAEKTFLKAKNTGEIWSLPKEKELPLRNRTHKIASRNLLRIEKWRPFQLTDIVVGENGENWWEVQMPFAGKRKNLFLPTDEQMWVFYKDGNKWKHLNVNGSPEDTFSENELFWIGRYIGCYRLFEKLDFFATFDCLLKDEQKWVEENESKHESKEVSSFYHRELYLTLQYETLRQISLRATSLNNQYVDFVRQYPLYFDSDPKGFQLFPSQVVLMQLSVINKDSSMLQYFYQISEEWVKEFY